jgi:hypothetical protein
MTSKTSLQTLLTTTGLLCLATTAMADQHVSPSLHEYTIAPAMDAAGDGETIWLSPGEYVETFDATEARDYKTLRFVGTGKRATDTVIRSNRFRHHFGNNGPDEGQVMNYTFENITFATQNSLEQTMDGLWFINATVRFVNCRFVGLQSHYRDNVDQVDDYETFGAIYLSDCTASFENCEVLNNGIAFDRLTDYTCKAQGGAINAYGSDISINNCNFEGNFAISRGHATDQATSMSSASGGALYVIEGRLDIDNTRFHQNRASGYASLPQPDQILGGAIFAANLERMTIDDCEFEQNSAEWGRGAFDGPRGFGGAIYIGYWEQYPFPGPGTSYLSDNRFYRNTTDFDGGAVHVGEGAVVKIRRSDFECNSLEQASGPWLDRGGNEFIEDCDPPCHADLNGDGYVDKYDMYVIFGLWGKVKSYQQRDVDFNRDGLVKGKDLIEWTSMARDCRKSASTYLGK